MPIGSNNLISGNGHLILCDSKRVKIPLLIVVKYLKKKSGNRINSMFITIKVLFLDPVLALSINRVKMYVDNVTPDTSNAKTGLILI
jgi:hypothetical protein